MCTSIPTRRIATPATSSSIWITPPSRCRRPCGPHGHEPCVVLQTSPGNLQAWVQISATPIDAAVASQIGKQLAHVYGGDLASTDWRHLGRLAGFTNQKPQRRNGRGYSPWVKVLHAHAGLASQGAALRTKAWIKVHQRRLVDKGENRKTGECAVTSTTGWRARANRRPDLHFYVAHPFSMRS